MKRENVRCPARRIAAPRKTAYATSGSAPYQSQSAASGDPARVASHVLSLRGRWDHAPASVRRNSQRLGYGHLCRRRRARARVEGGKIRARGSVQEWAENRFQRRIAKSGNEIAALGQKGE